MEVSNLRLPAEAGLTLIEVIVAMAVLLTGVLGAARLVDAAGGQTVDARGRAGAVALARRVIEQARALPPSELSRATLAAKLQDADPELRDATSSDDRWTVPQRGYAYELTVDGCDIDDPADGTGATGSHNGEFCSTPQQAGQLDQQPSDYRRLSVRVSWSTAGESRTVRQVAELAAGMGRAPGIAALSMTSPASCTASCAPLTAGSSATFAATTTAPPASLTWLVNGAPVTSCPPATATCSGSATSWTLQWQLGTPLLETDASSPNAGKCVAGSYVYDGVHEIGVRAADSAQLAGPYSSMSVSLNRCPALAPAGLNATGRDRTTPHVDIEWRDSTEGDIVGYRVYRGESLTNLTAVCPASVSGGELLAAGRSPSCVDSAPPDYKQGVPLFYAVVAVDRDPQGALREGAISAVDVNTGNRAPTGPAALTASAVSGGVQLSWTLDSTLDPDSGDAVDSFRIYRRDGSATDSPTRADRYDREALKALCSGSTCTYVDTGAGGEPHTYWITAVDTRLRESDPSPGATG